MAKQAKVSVDQGTCIGCGTCSALTPEIFEANDEGIASVTSDAQEKMKQDPSLIDSAQDTAVACPVEAIKVEVEESED